MSDGVRTYILRSDVGIAPYSYLRDFSCDLIMWNTALLPFVA